MRVIQRICSILLLLVTFGASALYAQTYDKLWKQVEQAQKKSLPQTVIKLADEIYRKGRQEQNAPQMLKAYICRETYQEGLTPDSLYSSLKYMEKMKEAGVKIPVVEESLMHMIYTGFFSSVFQIIEHDIDRETAKKNVHQLKEFNTGGWERLWNIEFPV